MLSILKMKELLAPHFQLRCLNTQDVETQDLTPYFEDVHAPAHAAACALLVGSRCLVWWFRCHGGRDTVRRSVVLGRTLQYITPVFGTPE